MIGNVDFVLPNYGALWLLYFKVLCKNLWCKTPFKEINKCTVLSHYNRQCLRALDAKIYRAVFKNRFAKCMISKVADLLGSVSVAL